MIILPLLLSVVVVLVSSCVGAAVPEASPVTIIPGESLKSTSLHFDPSKSFRVTGDGDGHTGLLIGLTLDLDVETEVLSRIEGVGPTSVYTYSPNPALFECYGPDAQKVQDAYKDIFAGYYSEVGTGKNRAGITSTIFYCGGMVITANTTFAGIPAGENLAYIVHGFPDDRLVHYPIPTVAVPDEYVPLRDEIGIKFWQDDFELVAENVTLRIEIPVKVGMLLTLLNERLNTPDAELHFRDEVLICTVTIPRGLH